MLKRYKHMFHPLDFAIYLNILMFAIAPFQTDTVIEVKAFSFFVGLSNLLFIVITMRLRHQLYTRKMQDIKKEAELEDVAKKEGNQDFINLKQEMLENRVYAELKNELPNAKFIRNAYVPKKDNEYAEIDILVIDVSGIYLVEVKNRAGKIIGNFKEDDFLKIEHPNGSVYDLYNPIKQNTNHYKHLKNVTGLSSNYFRSIIVFGDHTLFDKKTVPIFCRVAQLKNLMYNFKQASSLNPIEIPSHQVDQIYETLDKYLKKTDEKQATHIDNIRNYAQNKA